MEQRQKKSDREGVSEDATRIHARIGNKQKGIKRQIAQLRRLRRRAKVDLSHINSCYAKEHM